VLTKKNAISGWYTFIKGNNRLRHSYTVTNYEQASKLKPVYDLVIIDESHNTGAFPTPSKRYKDIVKLSKNIPHIHLSGTAIVESPCSIFHQMCISKFRPFKHKNFYEFHKEWGIPHSIYLYGNQVAQYNMYKPELLAEIDKFTIYMTQEDAGINLQAEDQIHYVELNPELKKLYNELLKHRVIEVDGWEVVCDTVMKLRVALHMLESGVIKHGPTYLAIANSAKINYVLATFTDEEGVGIMCHFVGERRILENMFKKATIYSSNSHAEGVDLSHLKHFVILSSDYSGARFVQRRERIVNINGSNSLVVHHILVKGGISEQVYEKVSKKKDFNNSTYENREI